MPDITFEFSPAGVRDLIVYKRVHDGASPGRIREIQREIADTWSDSVGRLEPIPPRRFPREP